MNDRKEELYIIYQRSGWATAVNDIYDYEVRITGYEYKIKQLTEALEYYANLKKCGGLECCGNCGDSIIAEDALDGLKGEE